MSEVRNWEKAAAGSSGGRVVGSLASLCDTWGCMGGPIFLYGSQYEVVRGFVSAREKAEIANGP